MCNNKILTPWPGHTEICDGAQHCYIERMQSKHFPAISHDADVTPEDFGENLSGTFKAPCPEYDPSKQPGPQLDPWERRELAEIREARRIIDTEYFIHDRSKTLSSFDPNFNNQHGELKKVISFLSEAQYRKLLLLGEPGRGKTHLAFAIKNYSDECGIPAEIISATRLYKLFREDESYDGDPRADKVLSRIRRSRVFIVDDLGVEKQTEAQVFNQHFQDILDTYSGRIVITSNLSLSDMQKIYGEKIVSRLQEDALFVLLRGKDHRRLL